MEDSILYGKSDTSTLKSRAVDNIMKYINLFERIGVDVSFFGDNIYNLLANATFEEASIEKTFVYDPDKNAFKKRINYGDDSINVDDFRYAVLSLFLNASKKMQEDDFEELFVDGEETLDTDTNLGLEFTSNGKKYNMIHKKVCERISELALGNPDSKVVTVPTYEDDIFRNIEYLIGSDKLMDYFVNSNGSALYTDMLRLFNGNTLNCKRFLDTIEAFDTVDKNNSIEYNRLCKNYHDIEQGLERIAAIMRNSQDEVKKAI